MIMYYQKTDQENHYVDSTGNTSKLWANWINVDTSILLSGGTTTVTKQDGIEDIKKGK